MSNTSVAKPPKGKEVEMREPDSDDEDKGTRDVSTRGAKIDYFYGDRAKLRAYLVQVKLAFDLQASRFEDDTDKVKFAATYLRGSAFSWFEPHLSDYLDGVADIDTKRLFHNFGLFEDELKKVFGTVDEARAAARQIHQVKQVGSAAQYYSTFQQIAKRLSWDDKALHSAFYMGLKHEVKAEMKPAPPEKYKALVDQAIKLDNRLYELRMERKGQYGGGRYTGGGYKPTNQRTWDPMDLDAMEHGRPSRPFNKPRFQRGSNGNKERERRQKDNLCYNCGKPGHRARECKTTAHGLHMMSDDITGSEETKADTSEKTQMVTADQSKGWDFEAMKKKWPIDWTTTTKHPETAQRDTPEGTESENEDWEHVTVASDDSNMAWETVMSTEEPESYLDADDGLPSAKEDGNEAASPNNDMEKTPYADDWKAYEIEVNSRWAEPHARLYWLACHDDLCPIHYDDKVGGGFFPHGPIDRHGKQPGKYIDDRATLCEMQEERPYEILATNAGCILIRTRYWGITECPQQCAIKSEACTLTHYAYKPYGQPGNRQKNVMMWVCNDSNCQYIEDTHTHDVIGCAMVGIQTIETESLNMMNDEEPEAEISETTSEDDDAETSSEDEVSDDELYPEEGTRGRYIVTEVCRSHVELITNHWAWAPCNRQHCNLPAQHNHIIFAPLLRTPQEYVRRFRLLVCWDRSCEHSDQMHVHQGDNKKKAVLEIPNHVADKIRREPPPDLITGVGATNIPTIDEREYTDHVAKYTNCTKTGCSLAHIRRHKHLVHIDPSRPGIPISKNNYRRMIEEEDKQCHDDECEWKENNHAHFFMTEPGRPSRGPGCSTQRMEKETTRKILDKETNVTEKSNPRNSISMDMMVDSHSNLGPLEPTIIGTVIDERYDPDYIGEYFQCANPRCSLLGKRHTHAFNIDPDHPTTPIIQQVVPLLEDCARVDCEWKDYCHVHYPKNE
jgi:hypothetical protein